MTGLCVISTFRFSKAIIRRKLGFATRKFCLLIVNSLVALNAAFHTPLQNHLNVNECENQELIIVAPVPHLVLRGC